MRALRQGFYLLLGLTFPGFWVFHAAGKLSILYRPLQWLAETETTGWPSFISASLLYLAVTVVFEFLFRILKEYHP
jgi:hypothetical protein